MKHAVKFDTTEEKAYVLIAYGAAAFSLLNLMPGLPPVMSVLVPVGQFLIFLRAKTQFARFGAAQALIIGILLVASDFILWIALSGAFAGSPRFLLQSYAPMVVIWAFNLIVSIVCILIGTRAAKGKLASIPIISKLALRIAGAGKRDA